MTTPLFHPATVQLLLLQSRGRRRRMWERFCQPRRLVLSAVACVMAVVWLGNAAMTIWLRESASPETLRALLSLGLVLYAGWHFAKAAFFRPESPFDWTPAERELLLAMPLRPRDLVAYQLASVTVTTFLKAGLFTLLLWPDLRSAPMGLAGLLLAMMMLEMLRMAIDIATWGMGRSAFLAYRAVVVAGLLGARRRWGSLLTAMIAPAVIACVPGFVIDDPDAAFLSTAGTLAFYTFLLLPTALHFDFRRDLDRLATLKGLPIAPWAAVIGQTLAPVLIATLFQTGVLMFAVAARSLPPHHFVMAMLVMAPLNVLVFGLDNHLYLLYPYRVRQEGLEIFLRTMLTFTGKGLLFAIGLAAMSVWGFATASLTRGISHWTGIAVNPYTVFTGGMIAGPSVLAALALYGLCWTYRNMNPIEDIPR